MSQAPLRLGHLGVVSKFGGYLIGVLVRRGSYYLGGCPFWIPIINIFLHLISRVPQKGS